MPPIGVRPITQEELDALRGGGISSVPQRESSLESDEIVEILRRLRDASEFGDSDDLEVELDNLDMETGELLQRYDFKSAHLNRRLRALFHKPKPDWHETGTGEVCRNACNLPIEDLVSKVVGNKKATDKVA